MTTLLVVIEDCAFHFILRMASVHRVEHSRAFENTLKIALGRIPSHKISAFRCTCELIENRGCDNMYGLM